jgi:GDPmannose 4,6-dehydratase
MTKINKVLITGINGQDGTFLAEELSSQGVEVHGVGSPKELKNNFIGQDINLHDVSLEMDSEISKLLSDITPDVVYHFAAQSSVSRSFDDIRDTFDTNVIITQSLLNSIFLCSPNSRVILAGSSEMFDVRAQQPWDLDTPLKPVNPYGESKAINFLNANIYRRMGLNLSTAILFNHESRRRPKHFFSRKVIDSAIEVSKGLAPHIKIGDFSLVRDFGYAPEYMEALRKISELDVLEDFVICTGKPISLLEFASSALIALGVEDHLKYIVSDPSLIRQSDPPRIEGAPFRATKKLGWTAVHHGDSLVRLLTSQAMQEIEITKNA